MNDTLQVDDITTLEKDIEDLERLVESLQRDNAELQEEIFNKIAVIERLKAENDLLKEDVSALADRLEKELNRFS